MRSSCSSTAKAMASEPAVSTLFSLGKTSSSPGEIKVSARRNDKEIANQPKQTAGEAVALRLTPITAPGGWLADGSDIALIDFEVVDAEGRRCPTDQARVDFEVSGPAIWRGGYNSGKENSTNHLHLDTECGINRVSIRSTLTPGEIVITARRDGLAPATLRLKTLPVALENGIVDHVPQVLASSLPARPEVDAAALAKLAELRDATAPAARDRRGQQKLLFLHVRLHRRRGRRHGGARHGRHARLFRRRGPRPHRHASTGSRTPASSAPQAGTSSLLGQRLHRRHRPPGLRTHRRPRTQARRSPPGSKTYERNRRQAARQRPPDEPLLQDREEPRKTSAFPATAIRAWCRKPDSTCSSSAAQSS
jgi:hypothetical protein